MSILNILFIVAVILIIWATFVTETYKTTKKQKATNKRSPAQKPTTTKALQQQYEDQKPQKQGSGPNLSAGRKVGLRTRMGLSVPPPGPPAWAMSRGNKFGLRRRLGTSSTSGQTPASSTITNPKQGVIPGIGEDDLDIISTTAPPPVITLPLTTPVYPVTTSAITVTAPFVSTTPPATTINNIEEDDPGTPFDFNF